MPGDIKRKGQLQYFCISFSERMESTICDYGNEMNYQLFSPKKI